MTPYFKNARVTIYNGDSREVMKEISGCTAVVTDPPYELGFMGKAWDKSRVAFDHEFWQLAKQSVLPGAHLLAFGGSRTFHRIACAIEDAEWEIRDVMMWIFGSGFPKSLDVSKAIDKEAGAERSLVETNGSRLHHNKNLNDDEWNKIGEENPMMRSNIPVTSAAKLWNGYGTALKPAFEPIILARKPFKGTVAQNVTENGCGALNIDGCRVGNSSETHAGRPNKENNRIGAIKGYTTGVISEKHNYGRWPANVLHDGSEEVGTGFPSSESKIGSPRSSASPGNGWGMTATGAEYSDSGSAARFFYCAKASGDERADNTHATVKPLALMEYLCRLIKQPKVNLILDPFAGSGTTLLACELLGMPSIGIEMDEGHCEIIAKRFEKPADLYLI